MDADSVDALSIFWDSRFGAQEQLRSMRMLVSFYPTGYRRQRERERGMEGRRDFFFFLNAVAWQWKEKEQKTRVYAQESLSERFMRGSDPE